MSVDKVILKAILSTLAAIGILIVFAFVVLVAGFPGTTMEMAYDLGMEKACIRNAKRAYKRTDDVYFIAYATKVSIATDNHDETLYCGKKLIQDDQFAKYCSDTDAENALLAEQNKINVAFQYEQYIYGRICVAEYALGYTQEAVEDAFAYTTGFAQNNAVVAVYYAAKGADDNATVSKIGEKLIQVQTETFSAEEKVYYERVLGWLNG